MNEEAKEWFRDEWDFSKSKGERGKKNSDLQPSQRGVVGNQGTDYLGLAS